MMPSHAFEGEAPIYDLFGVGIGPFNLGLAALAHGEHQGVSARFFDGKKAFAWHPGMLLPGTRLQVPFLADLVSLVDPTSPYSFLNYLRVHGRLYRFYFYENFHIPRDEYDHYCRWVAEQLPSCVFGEEIRAVVFDEKAGLFQLPGTNDRVKGQARHLVCGVGWQPSIPACFIPHLGERVFHTKDFLMQQDQLRDGDVLVLGSGQSAAEAFLALAGGDAERRLYWVTRASGFLPMEYSKLGLSQFFTPDYTREFYALPSSQKDTILRGQSLLFKGISAETLAQIYDVIYEATTCGRQQRYHLYPMQEAVGCEARSDKEAVRCEVRGDKFAVTFRHAWTSEVSTLLCDAIVLGTGYEQQTPRWLEALPLDLDEQGRLRVMEDYRVAWAHADKASIFVQNAEFHTHGVGAPDLGLGAYRNARILNAVAGRAIYPVSEQHGFHSFAIPSSPSPRVSGARSVRGESAWI